MYLYLCWYFIYTKYWCLYYDLFYILCLHYEGCLECKSILSVQSYLL